jgi:ribosomal protein S7
MMNGRNNGKKLMAVRIVAHSFEIVRTIQLGPYTMTTSIGIFCYQAISSI